jgi:hypothetical protein
MTTKPPASVREFSPESLEKIAYASVNTIPTVEPNDRYRLGYHIFRWLVNKEGTIEEAIASSGSRIQISPKEASKIIHDALQQSGIS